MTIEEQIDEASGKYEEQFGDTPDFLWFRGDCAAYLKRILDAISSGIPIPDYRESHGIPADALI